MDALKRNCTFAKKIKEKGKGTLKGHPEKKEWKPLLDEK